MATAKALNPGDRCPNCNGTFEAAPVPTDEQRARAAYREDPSPLPPHFDTATPEFRAEHGALHRCSRCTYVTRFPLEAEGDAAAAPAKGRKV